MRYTPSFSGVFGSFMNIVGVWTLFKQETTGSQRKKHIYGDILQLKKGEFGILAKLTLIFTVFRSANCLLVCFGRSYCACRATIDDPHSDYAVNILDIRDYVRSYLVFDVYQVVRDIGPVLVGH